MRRLGLLTIGLWVMGCAGDKVDPTDFYVAPGDADTDSDADSDSDADADSDADSDADTDPPAMDIPRPGNGFICQDTEPNNNPNQAVPCGVVNPDFQNNGGLYMFGGSIGQGQDNADWYSFRTGAQTTELHQNASWFQPQANLLDWVLYEVTGDGTGINEIRRSESNNDRQEPPQPTDFQVNADTWYVLEVFNVQQSGNYDL